MLTALPPIGVAAVQAGRRRVASTTPEAALEVLKDEYLALCVRRERRRPTGRVHTLKCPACHRFVASLSQPCGCGWDPAVGWGT